MGFPLNESGSLARCLVSGAREFVVIEVVFVENLSRISSILSWTRSDVEGGTEVADS